MISIKKILSWIDYKKTLFVCPPEEIVPIIHKGTTGNFNNIIFNLHGVEIEIEDRDNNFLSKKHSWT